MSIKCFLANEISLKVEYKIFFIKQFSCKIFYEKQTHKSIFRKQTWQTYEIFSCKIFYAKQTT
jgi:hypothetical protein